ncbi:MAG: alpha-2-macroglobulin family protein, partial [Thermodesulfovibrionales bacterium]
IFLGPYTVSAGGVRTHTIQLPQYIGSVRTMVVAAGENSYGSVEKTTPVKKPLMILGTAPRTIKTGETFKLPVTVFAMKPEVKNVSVSVKTNGLLTINGASSKSLTFSKEGEKYIDFELSTTEKTGVAKIEITAISGNNISKYNIEMDVSYPNTYQTQVIDKTTGNYELAFNYQPGFIKGTNETYLEIYNIPPLNLEKRIQYLTSYPHGCLEQKISGAFPQLYLSEFIELTNEQKEKIKDNIISTLNLLQRFQLPNGGGGLRDTEKDAFYR